MQKKRIAVLGAGTMGVGIAQMFATAGHEVLLVYVHDDKQRSRPVETMKHNLGILIKERILSEDDSLTIINRVRYTDRVEDVANFAAVVVECIVENLEIKQNYFQLLDTICPPDTILATNTSAISVTQIAQKVTHKERIIGTHFWNPAYLLPLVEVVKTAYVAEAHVDAMCALLHTAGKKPVVVQKDVPGFLANRLQHALFREAISIVEHGIATAADVDDAIKYGFGMRLGVSGPMETMDRGGIDLTHAIHAYLFPHIESSTTPANILTELLERTDLGFKTGQGFQPWSEAEIATREQNLNQGLISVLRALNRL